MKKLTYLESYKDAGLYREWIVNNYNRLGFRIYKHIKKLGELSKINYNIIEKEIFNGIKINN